MKKVKVIVVGCGNMGSSHARAYDKLDEFEIVGIVDANPGAAEAFTAAQLERGFRTLDFYKSVQTPTK